MKVSRPFDQIKPTATVAVLRLARATLPLLLALGGVAGCAPFVAQAPFSYRGDTVEPGDLLGPFDGRVVDAQSGKPLPGALVQASWAFETGRGLVAPAGGITETVPTDADGQYNVDRLASVPGTRSRVTGVTITIYQRGYVAYRSDRVFDGTRTRSDFCQHLNVVKMERWNPGLSHVQHVRFVGGAGPLKRALGSELVEASLELSGGGVALKKENETRAAPLDIGQLLSVDELKAVTNFGGRFTVDRLGDLPTSATYDSRHFRAVDKPETYDAALRVWKMAPVAAQARYEQLLKEVPHAEAKDELGDRSLRGYDGRIAAVATLDVAHGVVIELTCGLDQCRDADQAALLLRRVLARIDRLGAPTAAAPAPATPAPAAPAPSEEPAPQQPSEPTPAPQPEPKQDDNQFHLRPPELKR